VRQVATTSKEKRAAAVLPRRRKMHAENESIRKITRKKKGVRSVNWANAVSAKERVALGKSSWMGERTKSGRDPKLSRKA
jgi:hypothetical protein